MEFTVQNKAMSSQDKLSPREIEIAKLLTQEKSSKQIEAALNISTRAVEFHLTNIYKKLGVSSRI